MGEGREEGGGRERERKLQQHYDGVIQQCTCTNGI